MSLWDERFKTHPLWGVVAQLRATMNRVAMPRSRDEQDILAYAGAILELLERRRQDSDGREISPAMLTNAQTAADNFRMALDNVAGGAWPWAQLPGYVDEVVTVLATWPPMKIAHWLNGLRSATESFQTKTADVLEQTSSQAVQVEAEIAALGERVGALSADVAIERQRITEAIADFTARGSEAVHELLDAQQERIEKSESEWSDHLAAQLDEADAHNRLMSEYELRSLNVLQAIGTNSTATDYGTYANAQNKAADVWRRFASTVFGAAGVWFIVSSLPWFTTAAATWESSLSRLGVTAAVAGVGAYAASESSHHRRTAREAKKVQLVLAALEPFIANLPEDDQNKIRSEAAQAIFVIRPEPAEPEQANAASLVELAKDLVGKIPSRPAS